MNIRFTVENFGEETEVFELKDQSVMDVRVHFQRLDGIRVYTYWSENQLLTSEMRRLELGPGESKSITMQWVAPRKRTPSPLMLVGFCAEARRKIAGIEPD